MAKKRRRRRRASRRQALKRQAASTPGAETQPPGEAKEGPELEVWNEQEKPSVLAHAIRVAGIAPIALLVASLALHNLWPWHVPNWFQPVIDKEVAVLTLSAGHSGIIGLLISNKGRFTPSTWALLVAAVATALAGVRTIGESTSGLVIAVMLIMLTVPAVWAEALRNSAQRIWGFARTWNGISTFLLITGAVGIWYWQAQDENYIKNWILIPFGVLAAIVIATYILWLLIRLIYRYIPILSRWLGAKVGATHRWLVQRLRRVWKPKQ